MSGVADGEAVTARRSVVLGVATTLMASLAGCTGGQGGPVPTRDPARVTTTGGDDVEVVVAQMVIREGEDGPRAFYRLSNTGGADATVAVRTELTITGGGTYEATGVVDVPAGGGVTLEYRVVAYEALSPAEVRNVRRGEADFVVFINGERRGV